MYFLSRGDPLPHDLLIAGPSVLNLFASIDQDDTNWIISLRDVGLDVSVRTAREGEREIQTDLPSRELTHGWLKASQRALGSGAVEATEPVASAHARGTKARGAGRNNEYNVEVLSTANLFRRDHRICVEISCLDLSTAVLRATNVEYIR